MTHLVNCGLHFFFQKRVRDRNRKEKGNIPGDIASTKHKDCFLRKLSFNYNTLVCVSILGSEVNVFLKYFGKHSNDCNLILGKIQCSCTLEGDSL